MCYNNTSHIDYIDNCDKYDIILNYIEPMIIAVGLVGNIIAILIFFSTSLKTKSSSIYLGSLSISDAGYLATLCVFDLNNTGIFCQISIFVGSVFSSFSVWITVAFTVERFIVVKFPLKRPHVCTVSRAKSIILVIFTMTIISQSPILWTSSGKFNEDTELWECGKRSGYEDILEIFNYIDTVVNLIIPLFSIIVLNILIIFYLKKYHKKMCNKESINPQNIYNVEMNEKDIPLKQIDYKPGSSVECSNSSCRISVRYNIKSAMLQCQRNITNMLLMISTAFIILNSPSYIIRVCILAIEKDYENSLRKQMLVIQFYCYQRISMILFYLNHGINFILYTLYGASFRKTMITYFLNKWRSMKLLCHKYFLCK